MRQIDIDNKARRAKMLAHFEARGESRLLSWKAWQDIECGSMTYQNYCALLRRAKLDRKGV